MLLNDNAAIYSHDFATWEASAQCVKRGGIRGVAVRGHEHRAVNNQEIGVRRRRPVSKGIITWSGQGQGNEPVGLAVEAT
jgi:hypothetical protein